MKVHHGLLLDDGAQACRSKDCCPRFNLRGPQIQEGAQACHVNRRSQASVEEEVMKDRPAVSLGKDWLGDEGLWTGN